MKHIQNIESEPMDFLTLDQTIAKLQEMKDSGIAGNTAVVLGGFDVHARAGWMTRIESVYRASVGKSDFDKGYAQCKIATTKGVEVIVLR